MWLLLSVMLSVVVSGCAAAALASALHTARPATDGANVSVYYKTRAHRCDVAAVRAAAVKRRRDRRRQGRCRYRAVRGAEMPATRLGAGTRGKGSVVHHV